MKFSFFFGIVIFGCLAVANTVHSQTAEPETYKLTFRLISWESEINDLEYVSAGGKSVPVLILPNGRSQFYNYEGPNPLVFGRRKTAPDGTSIFETAATVQVSDFKKRTLLMLFPKQGVTKQYEIKSIDDSDGSLPPGSFKFINTSNYTLLAKCGNLSGAILPNKDITLQSQPTDNPQIIPLEVYSGTDPNKKQRVYANRWPYSKTTRTLVFLFYSIDSKGIELKRILEDAAATSTPTPNP